MLFRKLALRLERLGVGTRLSFDELTLEELGRAFAEALESSRVAPGLSLRVNGLEVAEETVLKFL